MKRAYHKGQAKSRKAKGEKRLPTASKKIFLKVIEKELCQRIRSVV